MDQPHLDNKYLPNVGRQGFRKTEGDLNGVCRAYIPEKTQEMKALEGIWTRRANPSLVRGMVSTAVSSDALRIKVNRLPEHDNILV